MGHKQMCNKTSTYRSSNPDVREFVRSLGDNNTIEEKGGASIHITEQWVDEWLADSQARYLANKARRDMMAEITYELRDTPATSMEYIDPENFG